MLARAAFLLGRGAGLPNDTDRSDVLILDSWNLPFLLVKRRRGAPAAETDWCHPFQLAYVDYGQVGPKMTVAGTFKPRKPQP